MNNRATNATAAQHDGTLPTMTDYEYVRDAFV